MKMSWRVLMKDKELIFFPIMAGIGLLIALGIFFAIASATGSLDRLNALTDGSTQQAAAENETEPIDIVLVVLMFFSAYFITIFFNAALISAALERLRGGDPDVSSGLRHAFAHIHTIIAWAAIAATVGLILQILKSRNNGFTRFFIEMIGGVWEFMTFFVVPVLVSEGVGPIEAIKRSAGLVRKTWGRQITSNFGFMLVYLIAIVIGVVPALIFFAITPVLGIIVGVVTISTAFGTVQALEGIFKAALYEYAMGEQPAEFDLRTLQTAYSTAPAGAAH